MHGYRLDTSCSILMRSISPNRALVNRLQLPHKYCIYTDSIRVFEALENYHDAAIQWYVRYRHYESTVQQGFRYRVLLATKSRRNHRQRASGQRGKVGDDAPAASCSAIGYEARHHASYFLDLAGIMESAVG
ncbi:hypothetical protein TNCV_3124261 [Trichonephila clavipes]|nr:hypothetical protein TNCV_3124261 [Trichonephila clavipes]